MPLLPNKSVSRSEAGASKPLVSLVVLLIWFTVLAFIFLNRQGIIDWAKLRGYEPPAVVASLAEQTTMTDYGRKVFYVNHPVVADKAEFFDECPNSDREHSIVLGCYHGPQAGIFLLDVTDARLEGVEQVTAAHEMLHGAYDRLTGNERSSINKQLQNFYEDDLKDPRILKTIEAYKTSEPKDVVNEMHSILATEIVDLPPALESYYERYFKNRKQVTAFALQYQAEFTNRQTVISTYDSQLKDLKIRIEQLEKDLKASEEEIVSQRQVLDGYRSSGDTGRYNAGIPAYNNQVAAYNATANQLSTLVARYNQLVVTRNSLAQEADELVKNLSSDIKPINN